jgi:hypothetical protein
VEPADNDGNAGSPQRPGDMQRARILIGLHADQADKTEIAIGAHGGDDAIDAHPRIGLVDGGDFDLDIGAEYLALGAIVDEAIDAGERIRRHRRTVPTDDVAIVVVMRRLYQHDAEFASGARCDPLLR